MSPSQIIDALKKHMNVTNGPLAKKLHELLNMSSQTEITRLPASPSAASLSPEEEQQLLKQLRKIMKDHPGILNYTNSSGRPDSSQTRQFAAQQPFSCRESSAWWTRTGYVRHVAFADNQHTQKAHERH
ncbi:hypothetical protein OSTOST_24172 [Ostertagia ostertagi]